MALSFMTGKNLMIFLTNLEHSDPKSPVPQPLLYLKQIGDQIGDAMTQTNLYAPVKKLN